MRGYKVISKDMTPVYGDKLMKYEIGKTYTYDESLELGYHGYHFSTTMRDVFRYSRSADDLYCIVDTCDGNVIGDTPALVTNRMTIKSILSKKEIDQYINKSLENYLIHDIDRLVRRTVARLGYGLEYYLYDPNLVVRREVVKHHYRLDRLINDREELIRLAVAKEGYGLDILSEDRSWLVRMQVAKQGFSPKKMAKDNHFLVREEAEKILSKGI